MDRWSREAVRHYPLKGQVRPRRPSPSPRYGHYVRYPRGHRSRSPIGERWSITPMRGGAIEEFNWWLFILPLITAIITVLIYTSVKFYKDSSSNVGITSDNRTLLTGASILVLILGLIVLGYGLVKESGSVIGLGAYNVILGIITLVGLSTFYDASDLESPVINNDTKNMYIYMFSGFSIFSFISVLMQKKI